MKNRSPKSSKRLTENNLEPGEIPLKPVPHYDLENLLAQITDETRHGKLIQAQRREMKRFRENNPLILRSPAPLS